VARDPSVARRFDDRVDPQHQRPGHHERTSDVEALRDADARVFFDEDRAEKNRQRTNGDVDDEDPVPVDGLGQNATDE